jgi:hypothetical protein
LKEKGIAPQIEGELREKKRIDSLLPRHLHPYRNAFRSTSA